MPYNAISDKTYAIDTMTKQEKIRIKNQENAKIAKTLKNNVWLSDFDGTVGNEG